MRYVTFSTTADTAQRLGALHENTVTDVGSLSSVADAPTLPGNLLELIRQGPDAWRQLSDFLEATLFAPSTASRYGNTCPLAETRLHAPIPRPTKNVFCVGRNYLSHIEEGARARNKKATVSNVPVFFTKPPTSVTGPYDDIPWDRAVTQQVDWEVELGVIIGVGGRNIPRSAALDHVFGYTVVNDVSARDLQSSHVQFFKGKSLDGFCPMGPLVVTADKFRDPQATPLTLRVNGIVKQSGNTRDMIFPVDRLIESLSQGLTLEAGDILATGTPDGVGFARTPPEFLQVGDIMETEVEGIGTMRNRIVDHS
jgi:2-keto-4-pentenoate hydratase/2-oxohepta-3-ene-1,7-dioic acid hydratase in catechol pathway